MIGGLVVVGEEKAKGLPEHYVLYDYYLLFSKLAMLLLVLT